MPPIARRLRLLGAVLVLAQGAAPALAIGHGLAAGDYAASAAHAEPLGATHESSAHPHDCGACRHFVSKIGVPPRRGSLIGDTGSSDARVFEDASVMARGEDGPGALPRGPPVG